LFLWEPMGTNGILGLGYRKRLTWGAVNVWISLEVAHVWFLRVGCVLVQECLLHVFQFLQGQRLQSQQLGLADNFIENVLVSENQPGFWDHGFQDRSVGATLHFFRE
jgi:hypothetical protein